MVKSRLGAICLIAILWGCSPVFNWREVSVADTGVVALLPCKPDRATQPIPLFDGSAPIPLHIAGCSAGGATFSVSVVALPAATTDASAQAALQRWQQATQYSLKKEQLAQTDAKVRGAMVSQDVRTALEKDGQTMLHRAVYASGRTAGGLVLLQAQLLGTPEGGRDGPSALSAEAANTFFAGLKL
jgi:hypothetical protein